MKIFDLLNHEDDQPSDPNNGNNPGGPNNPQPNPQPNNPESNDPQHNEGNIKQSIINKIKARREDPILEKGIG